MPKRKEGATDTEWDIFQRLSYNESMRLLADECHDYTVRWFCGHGPECRDPSKPELALQIANRLTDVCIDFHPVANHSAGVQHGAMMMSEAAPALGNVH